MSIKAREKYQVYCIIQSKMPRRKEFILILLNVLIATIISVGSRDLGTIDDHYILANTSMQSLLSKDSITCEADVNKNLDWSRLNLNDAWALKNLCLSDLNSISVDLSCNNLSHVEAFSFGKFNSIRRINLSFNRITDIEIYAFYIFDSTKDTISKPSQVAEIDISHNSLNVIPWQAFVRLHNLTILNLSRNEFRTFGAGPIFNMTSSIANHPFKSLRYLNLSHNKISFVDLNLINIMQHIIEIDLSYNPIVNLSQISMFHFFRLNNDKHQLEILLINKQFQNCQLSLPTQLSVIKMEKMNNQNISRIIARLNYKINKVNWILELGVQCIPSSAGMTDFKSSLGFKIIVWLIGVYCSIHIFVSYFCFCYINNQKIGK